MIEWFLIRISLNFSATKSNYAHLLTEYVTAQQIGEGKVGPGECFPYYKKCPKSIFKSGRQANKYRFVLWKYDSILGIEIKRNLYHFHYSHISSEDGDSELNDNVIELDDTDEEIAHLNKNKDTAQTMFNM